MTTDLELSPETLARLAPYCSEFLVHAADVEGLCQGIDEVRLAAVMQAAYLRQPLYVCSLEQELVARLGEWSPLPVTYAGGGKSLDDLRAVHELGRGRVHLTFGSALDIFGGHGVKCVPRIAISSKYLR